MQTGGPRAPTGADTLSPLEVWKRRDGYQHSVALGYEGQSFAPKTCFTPDAHRGKHWPCSWGARVFQERGGVPDPQPGAPDATDRLSVGACTAAGGPEPEASSLVAGGRWGCWPQEFS